MQQCVHLRFPWPASWSTCMRKKEKKKERKEEVLSIDRQGSLTPLSTRLPIARSLALIPSAIEFHSGGGLFRCWPIRLECYGGNSRLHERG